MRRPPRACAQPPAPPQSRPGQDEVERAVPCFCNGTAEDGVLVLSLLLWLVLCEASW